MLKAGSGAKRLKRYLNDWRGPSERTADADFLLIHLKGMLQRQAAEQARLKAGTYTRPLFGST